MKRAYIIYNTSTGKSIKKTESPNHTANYYLFQDGEDSFCQSVLFENTFMAHFFILKTRKPGWDPNAACVMQCADT